MDPFLDLIVGTSTTVLDPSTPADLGFVASLVEAITQAYQGHSWTLLAGLVLTGIIAGLRAFDVGKKLPDKYVPWFAVGLAVLGSVAVGLQLGQGVVAILTTGLAVGVAAIGGWETIGKLFKKTP